MQIVLSKNSNGVINSPQKTKIRRPIIIFDMAFQQKNDRRKSIVISGAGMALAGVLRQTKTASICFMPQPLIYGEKTAKLSLPRNFQASERPLVFALSLYDDSFKEIQAEVARIKELCPRARIILGGPSVNMSLDLKALARFFPDVDAFVKGDGEPVIVPLLYICALELMESMISQVLVDKAEIPLEELKKISHVFVDLKQDHLELKPEISSQDIELLPATKKVKDLLLRALETWQSTDIWDLN